MWADVALGVLGWIGIGMVVLAVCCRGFYRLDADGEEW
jgi:hypothetical protein